MLLSDKQLDVLVKRTFERIANMLKTCVWAADLNLDNTEVKNLIVEAIIYKSCFFDESLWSDSFTRLVFDYVSYNLKQMAESWKYKFIP